MQRTSTSSSLVTCWYAERAAPCSSGCRLARRARCAGYRRQVEPPNERLYQFIGQLKLGTAPPGPAALLLGGRGGAAETSEDTSAINAENVGGAGRRAGRLEPCVLLGMQREGAAWDSHARCRLVGVEWSHRGAGVKGQGGAGRGRGGVWDRGVRLGSEASGQGGKRGLGREGNEGGWAGRMRRMKLSR